MREPTLENSGGQKQIFTLHNSPLQIHSPGHRRPTGQDPKIWERRYREPASALKSPPPSLSPLPMGVGLESPPLSQMSTRVQVSIASTFWMSSPVVLFLLGACKSDWQRLLIAFRLCFGARNAT